MQTRISPTSLIYSAFGFEITTWALKLSILLCMSLQHKQACYQHQEQEQGNAQAWCDKKRSWQNGNKMQIFSTVTINVTKRWKVNIQKAIIYSAIINKPEMLNFLIVELKACLLMRALSCIIFMVDRMMPCAGMQSSLKKSFQVTTRTDVGFK